MNDRPLFSSPGIANPQRRTRHETPLLPLPAKAPAQSWTIELTAAPGNDAPPVCRIRMLLKTAWRRHRLRAKIVAGPPAIATPGNPTGNQSSDGPRGPQIAFNEAVSTAER